MSAEHAGITIIIDRGPNRTVVNIPKAVEVGTWESERPVPMTPQTLVDAVNDMFWRPAPPPYIALGFRPIGPYTIREEDNPMHPTPGLSEHEQAEADRFGIHDEDRSVE